MHGSDLIELTTKTRLDTANIATYIYLSFQFCTILLLFSVADERKFTMSIWFFPIFFLTINLLPIHRRVCQAVAVPSTVPPAIQKYILTITSKLNETLYPTNSTLQKIDPPLYQALVDLQNASFPALTIISNDTWLNNTEVQLLNQHGITILTMLADRVITLKNIPLEMELAAMKVSSLTWIYPANRSIHNLLTRYKPSSIQLLRK